MKEKDIERKVVERWPWKTYKLNGPGERGKPDRQFLGPNGFVAFIEFKREGNEPTKKQRENLEDLRALGHHAEWFDDHEAALKWLKGLAKR